MKKSKLYISLFLTIAMIMSSVAVLYINAAQLAEDDTTATENDNVGIEQEFVPMMANECDYTSVNQMQQLINRGQAPSTVTYVHNGFQGQQPHVHFRIK